MEWLRSWLREALREVGCERACDCFRDKELLFDVDMSYVTSSVRMYELLQTLPISTQIYSANEIFGTVYNKKSYKKSIYYGMYKQIS